MLGCPIKSRRRWSAKRLSNEDSRPERREPKDLSSQCANDLPLATPPRVKCLLPSASPTFQPANLPTCKRSLRSISFVLMRFRTLLRNGAIVTSFPSITSALFPIQRRGEGIKRSFLSRFPGRFGGRACGLTHGLEGGHHPGVGAGKIFGVRVQLEEGALEVEGRASEIAKRRGQRRSSWAAGSGNA